jgi:cell division protein FtsI/penicillin-binding protein 2
MNGDNFHRYTLTGFAFATVAVIIVLQILRLQVGPERGKLLDQADLYQIEHRIVYPARGQIYDRWGNLLAGNQTVYEVGVDLRTTGKSPETIAYVMKKVLANHQEYSRSSYYDEVFTAASTEPTTSTLYTVVADYVTVEEVAEIKDWAQQYEQLFGNRHDEDRPTLRGLIFRPHLQRIYPEKDLASGIIGFVNREGNGFFGVESFYHPLLAGEPQIVLVSADPNQVQELPNIPDGASLILTVDREIQASMESILDDALKSSGAASGVILVMDPSTGEILAMASTPRIDLNEYWKSTEIYPGKTPFNKGVSADYEPGSVFKVLTMAAALDAGAVTPETTYYDTGTFEIGGYFIHNWNWGAWGEQTMQECMGNSLNCCLAWVATQLGTDRFYAYMQKFGIGRLTGVDLAEEVAGRLKIPGDADWYEVELGTNSYGQGVAVTPIQLATAVSAVANGGKMMQPHILYAYTDNGAQYTMPTRVMGIPISEATAKTLSEMLAGSLEDEASDALVPGYQVAGKTGTADISTPGGYTTDMTNASFVGWGPVDDPHFLVYIWLEKPTTSPWGSVVAAPVFRQVFEQLVVLTNLPPDEVRLQMKNGQ